MGDPDGGRVVNDGASLLTKPQKLFTGFGQEILLITQCW